MEIDTLILEKQIIGSVLKDPSLFLTAGTLRLEDVQNDICQDVWSAIRSLVSTAAELTVEDVLGTCRIAKSGHIQALIGHGSTDRDRLAATIKLLTDARRGAALHKLLTSQLGALKNGTPWDTVVSQILGSVTSDYGGYRTQSATSVRAASIERLKRAPREKIPTGLTYLDRHLGGGLGGGHLIGVGALTKTGKTTLIATISANLEAQKIPHQVFFLERHETFIEELKEARALGVNIRNLSDHISQLEERARQRTYTEYVNARGITADEIRHEVLYGARRKGIKVALVDYFQLIALPGANAKGSSRAIELGKAAQSLQATAADANVDIIATCQLEDDGRPRESNAIKFASNLYMNMHRDQNCPETWFEMIATNITPPHDIGSISEPALIFSDTVGPYFRNPHD